MSYAELDDHPRKHNLMCIAFTIKGGERQGREIAEAAEAQRAKVNG